MFSQKFKIKQHMATHAKDTEKNIRLHCFEFIHSVENSIFFLHQKKDLNVFFDMIDSFPKNIFSYDVQWSCDLATQVS